MHADHVRDLLHLQGRDELRAFIKEFCLPIDNRLGNSLERVVTLFDGLDQPLRRFDFPLDEFLRGGVAAVA